MKIKLKLILRKIPTALLFAAAIIAATIYLQSCRDYMYETSPDIKLGFSADSILFDTVFTTIGSSTRYFKIYNNHNKRVNISSIHLGKGLDSYFRINVDGRSGNQFRDVAIGPRDSLFVFVEVTVDPLDNDLPLIILDSVVFTVNNNIQDVKLVAWGQDANFIKPNHTDTVLNMQYHLISENTVWSGPKPYVVYGMVFVAPGTTLTVSEGTQIHFHNRSAMVFLGESTLNVEGQLDRPVVFQGDRLEDDYTDLPGQWGYIWLTATSRNHHINHAIIKNATYGIILDSIGSFTEPTLRISNTVIENMNRVGLKLRGTHVVAENVVVANCGQHAIYIGLGGYYDFRHITVANYFWFDIRQSPSLLLNNYYIDTAGTVHVRNFERVYFANSIVTGTNQEEIGLDFYSGAEMPDFLLDYSLVRTSLNTLHPDKFRNCLFNVNPLFRNTRVNDFRLNEKSPAIGAGDSVISTGIPLDIRGASRLERSDLGAIQFYEIPIDEPVGLRR